MSPRDFDVESWLRDVQSRADVVLDAWLSDLGDAPSRLVEAMRYGVLAGGKRLRPAMALAAGEAVAGVGHAESALRAGCAVELIHAYSLIHDDLPAMDDDDLRRGKPTVHVTFGEADGILTGDALQAEAFRALTGLKDVPVEARLRAIAELAAASGVAGMVGGQHLDLASEGESLQIEELERLARLKTGALWTAACVMGGIVMGADAKIEAALREFGRGTGLAFQVADDLLDVEGDRGDVGKATGKDAQRGKATFPALLGISSARERAQALVSTAVEALAPLGENGLALTALARYVVSRTR